MTKLRELFAYFLVIFVMFLVVFNYVGSLFMPLIFVMIYHKPWLLTMYFFVLPLWGYVTFLTFWGRG